MASIRRRTYTAKDGTKKRSKKWYVRYKDADGILREVPGFKDKEATRQFAAKLEREAELGRAGVRDIYADHRARPLCDHLADFEMYLAHRGSTQEHVRLTMQRLRSLMGACGFKFIADLSASRVQQTLADLTSQGLGRTTVNHYLRAAKTFCRWLVKDRRAGEDPLTVLSMFATDVDRRHVRRSFSESELARLIESVQTGPTRRNLTGVDRAMLYTLAAYTGLRASELASLVPASFELDPDLPTVCVQAGYSKRRREDRLPLHPSLIQPIRDWLATKAAGSPVWPGRWAIDKAAGKILKRDLILAGIAYRDDFGRVADFHSLRHTFITRLGRAGVSVQQTKELARHSDVNLTLGVYQHLEIRDATLAIESLPSLGGAATSQTCDVARRTGTDESGSPVSLPILLPIGGDFSRLFTAADGNVTPPGVRTPSPQQSREKIRDLRENPAKKTSEDDGARTRNLRIDSPVL